MRLVDDGVDCISVALSAATGHAVPFCEAVSVWFVFALKGEVSREV